MGMADSLTASNTKDILAEAKKTNQKLDSLVAELHQLNEILRSQLQVH